AFVLEALLALRAHHAEALAARAGSAAAARHTGGTRPRSRWASRRASAAARATVCGSRALSQRHAGKCKKRRGRSCTDELQGYLLYLLVPDELGEELLLEPVPELERPMPLLLGDVELLPDVLGDELLGELLLDVPPLEEMELLPDLLKWASHSCREIEPSPFLSTDENVGVELLELLAPPEALGEDDDEDELLEAPPEALPEDLLSVALGLEELLLPEDLLLSVALGLEELLLPVLP